MLYRKSEMYIFVAVVETGGFAAAARRLGLDASTVSKTMARIEDHLDVRLFNRNSRSLVPTEEGRTFFDGCRQALSAMQAAEASVMGRAHAEGGRLRVHVSPSVAEYLIGPALAEFNRRYPGIEFEFQLGNGYVDPVEAGIDVTISHERPTNQSFVLRRIGSTRMVVCASPEFVAAHGTPRRPADLLNLPCIQCTWDMWNTWHFERDGEQTSIRVDGRFRAGQGSMLRQFALAGLGVASLTRILAAEDFRTGRLVPLLQDYEPAQGPSLYAVYHDRRRLNARIRNFVDYIAGVCAASPDTA